MCPSPRKRAANTHGRRWAFMHRHDIIHEGRAMFTRWRIVQTPWFGIYLHRHMLPDSDRALHNHPWTFVSLVLFGAYTEEWAPTLSDATKSKRDTDLYTGKFILPVLGQSRTWWSSTIHVMHLSNYHRIRRIERVPTWTLLLVGPRRQKWGYATGEGWVEAQTEQQFV